MSIVIPDIRITTVSGVVYIISRFKKTWTRTKKDGSVDSGPLWNQDPIVARPGERVEIWTSAIGVRKIRVITTTPVKKVEVLRVQAS